MIQSPHQGDSGPAEFRPIVVAPTYNNFATLPGILSRIAAMDLPTIVVNDGSTDGTGPYLAARKGSPSEPPLVIRVHPRNRGKANALRTGFKAAAELGYTHAITIDTDGQLEPEQIPEMVTVARAHPRALVVGTRDDSAIDYPRRSRVGRRTSNAMVWLESGVRVDDSQCGFRVYPLGLVNAVRVGAEYFGYETEIITRAGWANCPIVDCPVRCRYLPPGERVSHFRPWLDTFRGLLMHAKLVALALLPLRHPQWPVDRRRSLMARLRGVRWETIRQWLSPTRAWRELREDGIGRTHIATGLATGVFIANLPLYGLQTALGLYAARRLHLHPLSVVAGSQVSTPPVGPVLVAVAITVGHLLLHGSLPRPADFDVRTNGIGAVVGPLLLEWTIGGVLVGVITGILAFAASRWLFNWADARRGRHQNKYTPEPVH